MKTVENMQDVIVTSAPMYNIVLKKKNESYKLGIYNFNSDKEGVYNDNPLVTGYNNKKVNGYKITYGAALEVRRPGNGIKGVEFPNASEEYPFTFDIDLSEFTVNGNLSSGNASDDFMPLLYYVGDNMQNADAVTDIPYSNKTVVKDENKKIYCKNSGQPKVTQDGKILHVSVSGYEIDLNEFPKGVDQKDSNTIYWNDDINSILEGVFSTIQFQVVYPNVNKNNETLASKYGNEIHMSASAEVKNMNAYSSIKVDNKYTETTLETISSDNVQTTTWNATSAGERNQNIWYSSTASNKEWTDEYTPEKKFSDVDADIAAVGAPDLGFTVGYYQSNMLAQDGIGNFPVAIDQLVLFDRDAFDEVKLKNFTRENTGFSCKISYGVAKDGKALTNESMKTAQMEDFKFYDKYEDLPKQNEDDSKRYCDVVYVQYRGCPTEYPSDLNMLTQFSSSLKADADIADKVYMVTAVTNSWNVNDLKDYEDEVRKFNKKKDTDTLDAEDWSKWVKDQTKKYGPNKLVEKITHSNPTLDYRQIYTIPTYENGVYVNNPNTVNHISYADGIYVIPYTTTITKHVAQQSSEQPRKYFNVSSNARYVDYKIDTKFNYWNDITVPEDSKTTVYFSDTLPKELTYIKNSAYWGGNYTSQYPKQGKVENGRQVEPKVVKNEDGTTTLIWAIDNVKLKNGTTSPLYYTCKLGNSEDNSKDVKNNEVIQNKINVQTTEDKRPFTTYNNNEVTTSITVIKNEEFYLGKSGKPLLELEDSGYFDLLVSNVSSNDKKNVLVVDTMPQDDYDGTIMKGSYQISSITLDKSALNNEINDVEIWYTDSYKKQKANAIKETDITEQNGWKKAEIVEENGQVYIKGEKLIGSWPSVIAYKDTTLKGNASFKLHIEYSGKGAKNDHLLNSISTMYNNDMLADDTEVDIVSRSLEGTVWIDENKDGKLDDGEQKLENVKVTLYVKDENDNYQPYEAYHQIKDGEDYQCSSTLYTDKNGHYKFDGLPAGEYKVEFTSSNGTSLGHYEATIANEGTEEQSSKVTSENTETKTSEDKRLNSGSIPNLTMPAKEDIVKNSNNHYSYNLPNQNLGLIIPSITISGEKHWDDQDNYDGLRPDSITLQIKNGDTVVKEMKVKESDNWKWSVELPKYDDQENEIHYTVIEKAVNGYESIVSSDSYDITNKHNVTKLTIPVTKKWDDYNNQDGKRSDKIIVHLYANNKDTGEVIELNETNNWKASFTDLNQYENGNKIKYTIKEVTVKDYTSTITGNSKEGFTITNKHTPEKINIQGQKTWKDKDNQDGKRPENITIRLYANGSEVQSKSVNASTNWSYEFKNLDKYSNGTKINYEIKEDTVDGYTTTIDGYNVTNTHEVAKINVPVTKVWNDNDNNDKIRPEKVIVHLYANNKDTGKTVELSEDNQWNASFDDLDQYEKGKEIIYTVVEDEVKGYQVGITGSQDTGYILTNTHGLDTVEIKGTKTWDDHNDQDKMRPTKITIRLLADGNEIAVKEVTKVTDWTYDFGNLAKYKDGKEIVYTISEDEVEGYKTIIKGFNITNSHIPTPSKPSTDTPSKDDESPKGDQSSKNEQPINGSQTPVVKGDTKTTNKQQTNKIKTGDDTHLILYVLFVVLSFMGILFLKKKAHN